MCTGRLRPILGAECLQESQQRVLLLHTYVNDSSGRLKHLEGEEITDTMLFTSGIDITFRPYLGTILERYYVQFLHY